MKTKLKKKQLGKLVRIALQAFQWRVLLFAWPREKVEEVEKVQSDQTEK